MVLLSRVHGITWDPPILARTAANMPRTGLSTLTVFLLVCHRCRQPLLWVVQCWIACSVLLPASNS